MQQGGPQCSDWRSCEKRDMWAQHAEKPRDPRGRGWSNVSTSQGVARNLPQLEAARESRPWSLQKECGPLTFWS